MGTGYTRNDTSNNIADGNVINASDLDGEYDAIESAFGTSGHTHDGTSGEGGPVTVLGPVQDFVASASEIKPKTNNTLDIGTSALQFKDLYLDGLAYIDGLGETMLVSGSSSIQFRDTAISINSSTDGQLDIDADTEIEITSPTIDINASTVVNISTDLIVGDDLTLQSDAAVLNFGADSDVSLTHVADTGLLLNAGSAIQFRDSALAINSSADGQLDIIADTQLEITTPTLELNSDAQIIAIGADGDVTITHEADTGLKMKAASGFELNLQTGDTSVESGNVLGKITFNAPSESSGSDALLDGAAIEAVSEATFASDNNSTALVFKTNTSAAATERMRLKSDGTLNLTGNADFDGDLDVDGTTNLDVVDIDGAVDMASTLQVDGAITSSSGATITTADNSTQLKLVSTDTDASVGPKLDLHRNSANPAADDIIGVIRFIGEDSASNEQEYAKIRAHIIDPTSGSEDTKLVIQTQTGGAGFERLMFSPTETNFNDDGGNIDFRVESDNKTHMFFVDAGNDHVNIGTSSDLGGLFNVEGQSVFRASSAEVLKLIYSDNDAGFGPLLTLNRPSSTPATNDFLGRIDFTGKNDADETVTYAQIHTQTKAVSDGSESSRMKLGVMHSGSFVGGIDMIGGSEINVNEDSADLDFRVESNGNAHMLFVDGGNDGVGISCSNTSIASSSADELVIGNGSAGTVGISLLSANNQNNNIFFGDGESGDDRFRGYIQYIHSTDQLNIGAVGRTMVVLNNTEAVFNEDSADLDFRIESDGNANMFVVDAGNNRVNIGEVNTLFNATAAVTRNDTASIGDFEGNLLLFDNAGSSTATNGGHLIFAGHDGSSPRGYAKIIGGKGNSTSGEYDGQMIFKVRDHGDSNILERLRIKSGETTFNEVSANQDFRIESDGDAQIFFVDAGNNAVGIKENDPSGYPSNTQTGDTSGIFRIAGSVGAIAVSSTGNEIAYTRNGINYISSPGTSSAINLRASTTGGVTLTAGATSFSAVSDETLKTITCNIENASDKVKTLRTVMGRFNDEDESASHPFLIAQDVQKVLPEAVSVDKEKNKLLLSYTDVIPLLTASLKEALSKIETLEAKVAKLEGV